MIEQLGTYVTRRRVQRGAVIFAKGDPGHGLMAVVRGSVRISLPTMGGRDVVLDHIHPGEVFGEMASACPGKTPTSNSAFGKSADGCDSNMGCS